MRRAIKNWVDSLPADEIQMLRLYIEEKQHWLQENARIPFIQFPADWKIKITPPVANATVRFQVLLPSGCEKSIYLDPKNSLGWGGFDEQFKSYWGVYSVGNDVGRCNISDIETLLELIADESEGGEED